jgi:type II secretory pathway pseudopilin PulG
MNSLEIYQGRTVKGFTLVELLLSVALIFIIAALTFPVGTSFYRSQMLREATDGVLGGLRRAQQFAHTGKDDTAFGVYLTSGSYTIFEGDSYAARNVAEDEVHQVSTAVEFSGLSEVVFSELEGIPSTSGAITLTVDDYVTSIEVSPIGYVTR